MCYNTRQVISMQARIYYDLRKKEGTRFYLRREPLCASIAELEAFLKDEPQMNSRSFAKKMMFSHEIKTNNLVEGYGDDIATIKKVIANAEAIKNPEKKARILNLYHAYRYILEHTSIDKDSLKDLYSITSKGVLDQYSISNMGEYYRRAPVYILRNGRLDTELDQGVPYDRIDEFLEQYFAFLHSELDGTATEEYIKSQILHFYFVYIHPYFDVNGRTSRTLAMWYLLNKKVYPYIIFNRGIAFKGSKYDSTITRSIETNDMTPFILMMLETVELELEKEYVMEAAASQANSKLNATDFQTLLYFLSMRGLRTTLDFATMYNRMTNSDFKRAQEIYEEMIEPLLDKGVLDVIGETKKEIAGMKNKILQLRPLDINHEKTKHLNI